MIQDCQNRPIGVTVSEWCQEHSITTSNYYYRMAQVRKACLDSLSNEVVEQAIVPIPMNDIVNIGLHFFLKNVRPYAASCSEA